MRIPAAPKCDTREELAPEIWQDERSFFRREPYRGWEGKLRKVMELVTLPWPDQFTRRLKTIPELKQLRDPILSAMITPQETGSENGPLDVRDLRLLP
jgi:hypothetical protein